MPKIHWFAPLLLVLLGTSCIYKQPLVRENALPVDPHFIGLWEEIPENEKTSNGDRMLVLKYSDTEYLVQQDEELYYRGYPIKIGGLDCIQLQLIGSNNGDLATKKMKRFLVARATIENDHLEIRWLDKDLVDDDLESTKDLAKAFLKHKDNPKLFHEHARFKRIKQEK
jgi:hypothetical protein